MDNKDRYRQVFRAVFICLIPALVGVVGWQLKTDFVIQRDVKELTDSLLITFPLLCLGRWTVQMILKTAAQSFFPWGKRNVVWTRIEREERIDRWSAAVFKFVFVLISMCYGYMFLSKMPWTPSVLWGTGSMQMCWDKNPLEHQHQQMLNAYYLMALTYQLHSLAMQLFVSPSRVDFVEMVLHHICAIFLISLSHLSANDRMGSLVLLTHDVGDVIGYLVKLSVDIFPGHVVFVLFLVLVVSWGYTRLYVFPFHLLRACLFDASNVGPGHAVFNAMLILLAGLHVYWFILFMVMGYTFLTTGTAEDIHDKILAKTNTNNIENDNNNGGALNKNKKKNA